MSLYDYKASLEISEKDPPFYALIMAAMLKADSINAEILKCAFPKVWAEFERRFYARGGELPEDK